MDLEKNFLNDKGYLKYQDNYTLLDEYLHDFILKNTNSKENFIKTLNNVFIYKPIKGPSQYKTHNFILRRMIGDFFPHVRFIICCDILCNESSRSFCDVAIFINNTNYVDFTKNHEKNTSELYRITGCGIRIKASRVKYGYSRLKNINNQILTSIVKINNDNEIVFFNGNELRSTGVDFFNILKETSNREFFFNDIIMEYKEINSYSDYNWYMIIDAYDFYHMEIVKHIEHVPIQEYEEIFDVDINKNVW